VLHSAQSGAQASELAVAPQSAEYGSQQSSQLRSNLDADNTIYRSRLSVNAGIYAIDFDATNSQTQTLQIVQNLPDVRFGSFDFAL